MSLTSTEATGAETHTGGAGGQTEGAGGGEGGGGAEGGGWRVWGQGVSHQRCHNHTLGCCCR